MSWYVTDFDGNVLVDGAPTRRDALRMYDQRYGDAPLRARHKYDQGDYEYQFAYPGEDTVTVWVFRDGTDMHRRLIAGVGYR